LREPASPGDLLVGALLWPGGKEHFMVNDALEELEHRSMEIHEKAQEAMVKPQRKTG
jgi:hypothetical protein